ncbi:hypothetical protein NFI96_020064 [Prochilodus magdalenae]|nr:hypothetical protein NFI96_020064 [Prochilodus magdalenae]
MNRENQLIFGLWITALQLMTGTGAFKVQLQPKAIMRHMNESLELMCMVVGCPSKATFTWKTTSDISVSGTKEVNSTTWRKVYNHLTTEDEVTVICVVDCGEKRQDSTKIKVYSFPTDPVIFRKDNLTLACTVLRVYPVHHFQLVWLHGDTVLSESPVESAEEVKDISSVYTPNVEYLGKNITCRVTLDLYGVPEDRRVRSVTVQYGPSFVKVSSNTTVKLGERLELRCDTDENANITWWKIGSRKVTLLGRNKVLVIENATWSSAGEYECEASNELASRRSKGGVTLQGPPNIPKLRLSHAANPRAGDNVTITCNSDISILSGRLSISGGSLNVEGEKESSSVSINIPSVQLKDSGLYYCKAQNEFGSTKSNISISVLAPPGNSTVLVHPSSEVMEDQSITVHCRTVSFPAASITLTRKADGVEFRSPNGTFHLLNLKSGDKGTYVVNFTNELGYEVQTFELIVKERQTITPILTKTLVPAVSSMSLLTAAGLLIRHLRRAKKGSSEYNMSEAL